MSKFILLAILAAFTSPAFADAIARQGSDWVRITASACTDAEVLERIAAASPGDKNAHLDFRAGTSSFQGQLYVHCWRPAGNVIHLMYGDGDQGIVPVGELKPDNGSI